MCLCFCVYVCVHAHGLCVYIEYDFSVETTVPTCTSCVCETVSVWSLLWQVLLQTIDFVPVMCRLQLKPCRGKLVI